MHIPFDDEFVTYFKYSTSEEIDVMFKNGTFYLSFDEMLSLFQCDSKALENAFKPLYKSGLLEKTTKQKKGNDYVKEEEMYYSLIIVVATGSTLNNLETNRYYEWAEETLNKYKRQENENVCIYSHEILKDFYDESEKYLEIDLDNGIEMDVLTRYLQIVSSHYDRFINKLIEIEKNGFITKKDLEAIDEIELCFIDRPLNDSTVKEFGQDIEKTIYIAALKDTISKLNEYMGGDDRTLWSDKIDQLKVKAVQFNVEIKQMFYFINRFEHFSEKLASTYESIVCHVYVSHFDPDFNFWDLCADFYEIDDIFKRRKLFVGAKIKAQKWLIEESTNNDLKKNCEDYIQRCEQSIELIDYEISQINIEKSHNKSNALIPKDSTNKIKPAQKKKTDVIKILSAMYDAKMFADAEGKPLTNKQKMMEAFGEFLGEDFSAYSTLLSQAKNKDDNTFMKPFMDIEKEAKRYFRED